MDTVNAIDNAIDACASVVALHDETLIDFPLDPATLGFNAALAAFVEASRDMLDLFDDDPSPVRVGRREVYPNQFGRPAVRECSRAHGGAHC